MASRRLGRGCSRHELAADVVATLAAGVEGRCEDVLKMELPGWRRGAGATGQDPAAAGGKGKTTEGKNKMNKEEPWK